MTSGFSVDSQPCTSTNLGLAKSCGLLRVTFQTAQTKADSRVRLSYPYHRSSLRRTVVDTGPRLLEERPLVSPPSPPLGCNVMTPQCGEEEEEETLPERKEPMILYTQWEAPTAARTTAWPIRSSRAPPNPSPFPGTQPPKSVHLGMCDQNAALGSWLQRQSVALQKNNTAALKAAAGAPTTLQDHPAPNLQETALDVLASAEHLAAVAA